MGLSTDHDVALVTTREYGGLEIITAKDHLGLVKLLINRGSISRGVTSYGSKDHKDALVEVEKSIAHARRMFAEQEEREARGNDDPEA